MHITYRGIVASVLMVFAIFSADRVGAQGAVVSDGLQAHDAASLPADGTGVVVGVIAPPISQTKRDALIAAQELPVITYINEAEAVLNDTAEPAFLGSDIGLDVMQLVHDMVPAAQLVLVSPASGVDEQVAMSDAVSALSLHNVQGVDVILDVYTLGAMSEVPFYDDELSITVETVASDILYVVAAGNEGAISLGDASQGTDTYRSATVYEAPFVGSTALASSINLGEAFNYVELVHQFGAGDGLLAISQNLESLCLFWSDKPGESYNDYDLFVLDGEGQLVDSSTDFQYFNPSEQGELPQEPQECISNPASLIAGHQVVVGTDAIAAENRFIHIRGEPGAAAQARQARVVSTPSGVFEYTTSGAIRGRAGVTNVVTVGAAPVPRSQVGDVGVFKAGDPISTISSVGDRLVFWQHVDGAYTLVDSTNPDLSSAASAEIRVKPDLVGADVVIVNRVSGDPSAPSVVPVNVVGSEIGAAHIAGLGAKLFSGSFADEVREGLLSTAVDMGPSGEDVGSGFGAALGSAAKTQIDLPMSPIDVVVSVGRGAATLTFAQSPDDSGFTYSASCSSTDANDTTTVLFTDVSVTADGYTFPVLPDQTVSCSVTASDGVGGATTSAPAGTGSTAVASLQAATLDTVEAEPYGFTLRYTIDDQAIAGVYTNTLLCEKSGSDPIEYVIGTDPNNPVSVGASPATFDDLEPDEALSCTFEVAAEILNAEQPDASGVFSFEVTPEAMGGLPIWLLLQAQQQTQPQSE